MSYFKVFFILFLFHPLILLSQVQIQSVKQKDNNVEITYDLTTYNPDVSSYNVFLYTRSDTVLRGTTYFSDSSPQAWGTNNYKGPLTHVKGDVGKGVKPGKQKKIIWNAEKEFGSLSGDWQFAIAVKPKLKGLSNWKTNNSNQNIKVGFQENSFTFSIQNNNFELEGSSGLDPTTSSTTQYIIAYDYPGSYEGKRVITMNGLEIGFSGDLITNNYSDVVNTGEYPEDMKGTFSHHAWYFGYRYSFFVFDLLRARLVAGLGVVGKYQNRDDWTGIFGTNGEYTVRENTKVYPYVGCLSVIPLDSSYAVELGILHYHQPPDDDKVWQFRIGGILNF